MQPPFISHFGDIIPRFRTLNNKSLDYRWHFVLWLQHSDIGLLMRETRAAEIFSCVREAS